MSRKMAILERLLHDMESLSLTSQLNCQVGRSLKHFQSNPPERPAMHRPVIRLTLAISILLCFMGLNCTSLRADESTAMFLNQTSTCDFNFGYSATATTLDPSATEVIDEVIRDRRANPEPVYITISAGQNETPEISDSRVAAIIGYMKNREDSLDFHVVKRTFRERLDINIDGPQLHIRWCPNRERLRETHCRREWLDKRIAVRISGVHLSLPLRTLNSAFWYNTPLTLEDLGPASHLYLEWPHQEGSIVDDLIQCRSGQSVSKKRIIAYIYSSGGNPPLDLPPKIFNDSSRDTLEVEVGNVTFYADVNAPISTSSLRLKLFDGSNAYGWCNFWKPLHASAQKLSGVIQEHLEKGDSLTCRLQNLDFGTALRGDLVLEGTTFLHASQIVRETQILLKPVN